MAQDQTDIERLSRLAAAMRAELEGDILPFWLPYMDAARGGFYGLVANDGGYDREAKKGLVMHSRFLWAYSAAYRRYAEPSLLAAARQAFDFLCGPLRDARSGGFWWAVDATGRPEREEKLVYGQAFAIYGLSEYYAATGDGAALELALGTWALLERAARDPGAGGYAEACDRAFAHPVVMALSEVDIPCEKSMNTNLHVLEALTSLARSSGREDVRSALADLVEIYATRIVRPDGSCALYFDRGWKSLTDHVSWGHDIESSWLLGEACEVAFGGARPAAVASAIAAERESTLAALAANDGSLPHERAGVHVDAWRDWWVQAECVTGLVDAWCDTGESRWLDAAIRLWAFIDGHLIDRERGEWFWRVSPSGYPDLSQPKGGLWKTCYHNGRACLEVMARAERMAGASGAEPRRQL